MLQSLNAVAGSALNCGFHLYMVGNSVFDVPGKYSTLSITIRIRKYDTKTPKH